MRAALRSFPVAVLLACACLGTAADAGAWPMEPGRRQSISTFLYDTASRRFDADGDAAITVDFSKFEASLFIEYGLSPRWTLVARPAVQQIQLSQDSGIDKAYGRAALEFGGRYLIAERWDSVLSVQALAIAPGEGENVPGAQLGTGGWGGEARILAGRSWGAAHRGVFADVQAGVRIRGDDADETRADATVGVRLNRRWMILGQTFSAWSMNEPRAAAAFESHKAQVSVVVRLTESISAQVGAYRTFAGREALQENAAFVSLWRRF